MEFNYEDPEIWDQKAIPEDFERVLYANSSRESGFTFGGGAGLALNMSENLAIYFDGSVMNIGSDLIDGIPNYDYVKADGRDQMIPIDGKSLTYQFTIGFVFTTGTDLGITSGGSVGKSGGRKGGGGTTSKFLPWYRKK